MKILRFVLVLAVIGYAGWLAWPFLEPLINGGGPDATMMRTGAEAGGGIPVAAFWFAAVGLYLIAALMLGSGNPKAAIAYFLGFIADAALRLAIDRSGGSDVAGPTAQMAPGAPEAAAATGLDPTWIVLGVLLAVGLLILVVSRRRRRARAPGQFAS